MNMFSNADARAIGRGFWKGLSNSVGSNIAKTIMTKADIHVAEGDKVAAAVATVLMVGGGIVAGVGQQIIVQVLPSIVETKEEKDAE